MTTERPARSAAIPTAAPEPLVDSMLACHENSRGRVRAESSPPRPKGERMLRGTLIALGLLSAVGTVGAATEDDFVVPDS